MRKVLEIARVTCLELWRRKDAYVVLILLAALLGVLLTADAFGLGSSGRHVLDIGLALSWAGAMILVVLTAGRQIPAEEQRRTILTLLSRPVTRLELIAGKWLGSWFACGLAATIFLGLVLLLAAIRGADVLRAEMLQGWLLYVAALGVAGALSLACTVRMNSDAGLTTAFLAVLLCTLVLPEIPNIVQADGRGWDTALLLLYHAVPHFELFDLRQRMVHAWGPVPPGLLAGVFLYALAWVLVLLGVAWAGFRTRRFSRETLL